MVITFNSTVFSLAPGADDIYTLKFLPSFNVFDFFPSRGTGILTLKTGVYAAFIDISPFAKRDPL